MNQKRLCKITTIILNVFIYVIILFLNGCNLQSNERRGFLIKDISYTNKDEFFTVYIYENDIEIPYLVISDNYNGNCLLIRKYALDQKLYFNENYQYASYYPDSNIDRFLNNIFLNSFNDEFKSKIIISEIETTSKNSLGRCGTDTEIINRKVFILSTTEVFGYSSLVAPEEGNKLKYFLDLNTLAITTQNGEPTNWWLRTPNTWDSNVVYGVDINGRMSLTGISNSGELCVGGIRPAFCINANTEIVEIDNKNYIKLTGGFLKDEKSY